MTAFVFVAFPLLTAAALWLFDRHRWAAVAFFGALVALFPFFSDSSDWVWFDWVKRYFIIVPCLLLAVTQWLSLRRPMPGWSLKFFAVLGFTNVLVFVAEDVTLAHWGNVLFGVALLISFPFRFSYDERGVVGFEDRAWVLAFCACDAIFIHFCPVIENSYFFVMTILPLEIVMLVVMRDWHKAFSFRLYSLGPFLLLDSFFDEVSDLAYLPRFEPALRIDPSLQASFDVVAAVMGVFLLGLWLMRTRSLRRITQRG